MACLVPHWLADSCDGLKAPTSPYSPQSNSATLKNKPIGALFNMPNGRLITVHEHSTINHIFKGLSKVNSLPKLKSWARSNPSTKSAFKVRVGIQLIQCKLGENQAHYKRGREMYTAKCIIHVQVKAILCYSRQSNAEQHEVAVQSE